MIITQEQRFKLEKKLHSDWSLGDPIWGDVWCLEASDYSKFLDNVKSLPDLIGGLNHLSPLADDALGVAERMNEEDFYRFKFALKNERSISKSGENSKMPYKYGSLVIPEMFIPASLLSKTIHAPLG